MVVQDVVIGSALTDYVADIRSRPLVVVVLAPRPELVAGREAARTKVAYRPGYDDIVLVSRRHDEKHLRQLRALL